MIRSCVFALLVVSVLSAKLTPGTRLPQVFDDMLFNNLESPAAPDSRIEVHRVSPDLTPSRVDQLVRFLADELAWADSSSLVAVAKRAGSLPASSVESHYLCQTFSQLSEERSALIHLVHSGQSLKLVVSQQQRTGHFAQDSVYHELRSSPFGLPFDGRSVLKQAARPADSLDRGRRELMAGLKAVRGTQKTALLGFDLDSVAKSANEAVKGLTDCWKNIVSCFKTASRPDLRQAFSPAGFRGLLARTRFVRNLGLPQMHWSVFMPFFVRFSGASKNDRIEPQVYKLLGSSAYLPENSWQVNDFTFDADGTGLCNSVLALTRHDLLEERYHSIAVVVDASFQLAPNLLFLDVHRRAETGLETLRGVRTGLPKDLPEADLQALSSLLLLVGLQSMAENLGLAFKLPDSAFQ